MENRQSYAEVLDAEAAHGPVRLLRPGEERLGDGRQRVDAVAREEARPREAAAVEPAGSQRHNHGDLSSLPRPLFLPLPVDLSLSLDLCERVAAWGREMNWGEFIGGGGAWREMQGDFGAKKMAVKGSEWKWGSCAGSHRR